MGIKKTGTSTTEIIKEIVNVDNNVIDIGNHSEKVVGYWQYYAPLEMKNYKTPVYRKRVIYEFIHTASEDNITIAHNISNLGEILHLKMELLGSTIGRFYNVPYIQSDGKVTALKYYDGTNLTFANNSEWGSGSKIYITYYYTKTNEAVEVV